MLLGGYFIPRRVLIAAVGILVVIVAGLGYLLVGGGSTKAPAALATTVGTTAVASTVTGTTPANMANPLSFTGTVRVGTCQGSGQKRRCTFHTARTGSVSIRAGAVKQSARVVNGRFKLSLPRPGLYFFEVKSGSLKQTRFLVVRPGIVLPPFYLVPTVSNK